MLYYGYWWGIMDSIDNIIISFFIKPNIIVNNILELTSDELDYLKTLISI